MTTEMNQAPCQDIYNIGCTILLLAVVAVARKRTWDYQIQLIGVITTENDNGFPIETEGPKDPILANKLSIRSNEWWQAKNSGKELSKTFEVHPFEYEGEEKLLYEKEEYKIERTFHNEDDYIELVCTKLSEEHEA